MAPVPEEDNAGQPVQGEKTYNLGPKTGKFKGAGDNPQDTVEFEIDVQELKQLQAQDDKNGDLEGTWQIVARVPRHPREPFPKAEHVTEPVDVVVQKKKLRVLLFAGGATREYQFVRTLFYREVLEKLARCGSLGAFGWMFSDYHPVLWDKPPYDSHKHERFFGLTRYDGTVKPSGVAMRDFAARVAAGDLPERSVGPLRQLFGGRGAGWLVFVVPQPHHLTAVSLGA